MTLRNENCPLRIRDGVFIAALISLSACTTPIAPSIADFAQATNNAMTIGKAKFEGGNLDDRIAKAERQQMVADGAGYALLENEGNCAPVWPNDLNPETTPNFDDVCPLRPATYENGKLIPYERRLVTVSIKGAYDSTRPNSDLNYERNARRSVRVIADYSAALLSLAEAEDPVQVGKSLGDAVKAVQGLAEAAANMKDNESLTLKSADIMPTASQLFDRLTREALEARRFHLLSEIVQTSDPLVQELSEAAALWFYHTEKDTLENIYEVARKMAEETAKPDRTVNDIKAAEEAIAAARRAEEAATWRVFWGVAVAHHAILESLNSPPNLELLVEANVRISDLVAAINAFTEAVNTEGK